MSTECRRSRILASMADALALVARRPGFRHLWLGNLVSQLGDWIGWVAVAVLALHTGGGPLDVALVFVAHHLPAAMLTPISGALADRFDRRVVLVRVSLLLGVVTVAMTVAAALGSLAVLQLLLVVRSAMTAFFTPAERAALPRVVERSELLLAGAIDAGSWSVVFSLGMALGGALSALGPVLALAIDAATFGVSALLLSRLPAMPPQRSEATEAEPRRRMAREIADAIRYLRPRPALRRAVLAKGPIALAGGAAWLALALRADALLGAALGFGLLNAIRGIGTGIGPALVAWRLRGGARRGPVWSTIYLAALVGMVAFAAADGLVLALVAVVVWGIGSGGNWVVSSERIAALGPDAFMARLGALDHVSMIAGQTIGVVALALWVGAGASLFAGVTILALLAAAAWAWLSVDAGATGLEPDGSGAVGSAGA